MWNVVDLNGGRLSGSLRFPLGMLGRRITGGGYGSRDRVMVHRVELVDSSVRQTVTRIPALLRPSLFLLHWHSLLSNGRLSFTSSPVGRTSTLLLARFDAAAVHRRYVPAGASAPPGRALARLGRHPLSPLHALDLGLRPVPARALMVGRQLELAKAGWVGWTWWYGRRGRRQQQSGRVACIWLVWDRPVRRGRPVQVL